jgi:hypothetical protein
VTTFNSFTTGASGTAPGTISTITPTNAATGVAINAPLTWTAPTGSPTEYYAYLGTNNTCDFATNYTDLGFWNGHHYFRHTLYSCTWPQAEAYAELDGGLWSSTGTGYLATIGSANENAKLAEAGFGSSYARWFGGSDRVIPNIWKWSNGDPWAYTNWWTNEPNNASPGQYYTVINWGASGRWDDQNTTTSNLQYFLMETVPNLADGTRVLTNSYTPSLLRFNTTYYWSAVGSNNYGMANDTQRWSFTTADGKAVNPSPANAATGVYSQNFTWDDVAGASSYLFYLGTSNGNWNLVNAAPCATSGYSYGGTLDPSTQYYWKVATVTALETVQGNTWNFTTGALLNVNVTSNPAGAAILNNSTATGQVTDHVFPSAYGSSAFYTVQMTDYDWTLDPLYDSNVITNLSSAQHINFIGNYHHVDITGGFEYIGDPGIVISGTTGTVGDLTVLPTNQNGLDQATIMIFTGTVNSSLTVHVASGTWYVIAYYGGAWHQGNPYPCVGAGDVIFADIPFGAKADIPVIISEGDQTLPVELSSFTATLTAEYFVNLTWITQSETEMNGFVVYRSTNEALSDAIIVSNVIPATNTSQQTEYNYIDSEVEPNTTYYYWLQAIGLANTDTFHGPILVNVTDNGGVVPPPVIPVKTGIANIFPNPFNPHTEIAYSLKDEATVQIAVFNCKGQQIRSLVSDKKGSGFYRTGWDGKDAQGRDVSGGIYYVRMTADNARYTQKMILLK